MFDNLIIGFDQRSYELPIDFNWTLAGNTTDSYKIQCEFSRPLSVSVGDESDRLVIFMAYVSPHDNTIKYEMLDADFPMLVADAEELVQLQQVAEAIGGTSRWLFYVFIVCNLLFSFALGQLWGTFQTLQVIIAMPMLAIKMP